MICDIEDALGDDELHLYPIDELPQRPDRAQNAAALDRVGLDRLADRTADPRQPHIAVQVVAAVAMAAGAQLDRFAKRARDVARTGPWADASDEHDSPERRAAMDQLVAVIDAYDGTPVAVTSPALFDQLAGHLG